MIRSRRETFDGPDLDQSTWLPYYLPHWSSRDASAAAFEFVDDGVRLFIAPEHPLWCPDTHPTPIRVSGIASGSFSGPVGSELGQQPFASGVTVSEAQPRFEGWLVTGGLVEVRCRMNLSARSMAALWLAGFEDEPTRAGEICVVEVFGRNVVDSGARIGVGHKRLGDPRLEHDFEAVRMDINVGETHSYAVEYDGHGSVFSVDGEEIKWCRRPPTYPMQFMIAVFDFPDWSTGDDRALVPELVVERVAVTERA
jgi:hypothetical protein